MPFTVELFDRNIDPDKLAGAICDALNSLQDQINAKPELHVNTDDKFPTGAKPGEDFLATLGPDGLMRLSIPIGPNETRVLSITDLGGPYETQSSLNFVGETSSGTVPTVGEYPLDQDWGFHLDTALVKTYIAINIAGTMYFAELYIDGNPFKGTQYLGMTTTAAAPTLVEYPNDKDWGFHKRTAGTPNLYFVFNRAGVVETTIFDPPSPFLNTQYLGKTAAASIPTIAEFPANNDWGFHRDTSTGDIYIAFNQGGVVLHLGPFVP